MGVKGDNLGINSGLLLPSFVLNYMVIRVKEKEFEQGKIRKRKREGERSREERNEEESKGFGG